MAKNFYFENYSNSMEQELIEDLVIESIRIYGVDTWYIPRTLGAKDDLLNEDDLPQYNDAFMVEMYVKNIDRFEGEGDFLSKFGVEIRDRASFVVVKSRWTEAVDDESFGTIRRNAIIERVKFDSPPNPNPPDC